MKGSVLERESPPFLAALPTWVLRIDARRRTLAPHHMPPPHQRDDATLPHQPTSHLFSASVMPPLALTAARWAWCASPD